MMGTVTDDLARFLHDRIAEDEQVAREAVSQNHTYFEIKGWAWWDNDFGGYHLFDRHLDGSSNVGMPARVLAECQAKRQIVEFHKPALWHHECHYCLDTWPCPTLCLLAMPYADHPDYRDKWRP